MYVDPTGEIAGWLIAKIIVAVVVAAIAVNHLVSGIECAIAESNVEDEYTKDEAKAAIEEITGEDTVTFGENSVQIKNSYNVKSRYDRIKVSKIIQNTVDEEGSKLTNRTTYGLAAEWLGHNITYNPKTNTPSNAKDVDLDYNFYNNETKTIIGTIALMIIGGL